MEQDRIIYPMLELVERPAFCVRQGSIIQTNQAARQKLLATGTSISDLLGEHAPAYENYSGGTLTLTVTISDVPYKAQVTRAEDTDVFVLDTEDPELRAIALAAQHLRNPLNSVMTVADALSGAESKSVSQLQRGLHRLHRMICNMSDSYRYQQNSAARPETTDITSVFDECMEAIDTHLRSCGISLQYSGLNTTVVGLADREMLERAIYNLVSNAVKFMNPDSILEAGLSRNGKQLSFTLQAAADPSAQMPNVFNRYQREPSVEDSRHGIGLGLPLIRAVATAHGGTVLIDQPDPGIMRITMTLSITSNPENVVRSAVRLPTSNYAGDRDRGLLELSEILPVDAYQNMD